MSDKPSDLFDYVLGERAVNHAQKSASFTLALLAMALTALVLIFLPSWPAVAGVMSMNGMVAVVCLALAKETRK